MLNRRKLMAACAFFIGIPVVRNGACPTLAQESVVATYQVDLEELLKAFPNRALSRSLPPLLARFGEWLSDKPWRSVGAFDLAVQWSDAHFLGGEFHFDEFALFMRMPDGSSVGYWLADRDIAHAPIVWLGSEGDFVSLAPNLETLLARIALGDFNDKGPGADFRYSNEDYGQGAAPDLRSVMQAFLRAQTGVQDLNSLVRRAAPPSSDFAEWIAKSVETHRVSLQSNPAMLAMRSILDKYRPVKAQPWEGAKITVTWVGDFFDAWLVSGGPKVLAETDQLKPHLAALRDEAAKKAPGLGLWHRVTLMVYEDRLEIITDYLFEPDFRSARPPAQAFRADQSRAPRAARRIPPWLATILA